MLCGDYGSLKSFSHLADLSFEREDEKMEIRRLPVVVYDIMLLF